MMKLMTGQNRADQLAPWASASAACSCASAGAAAASAEMMHRQTMATLWLNSQALLVPAACQIDLAGFVIELVDRCRLFRVDYDARPRTRDAMAAARSDACRSSVSRALADSCF